jgi:spore maturation protein CgeB
VSAGTGPRTEPTRLDIVVFGLSITSAWGNGHATTYRALLRALAERGHSVRFFERDVPWYAKHRDLPDPPYARTVLYSSLRELRELLGEEIRADLVIIGSYVPEAVRLAEWVLPRATGLTAFYDIDTPVTVGHLESGDCEYLTAALVPRFDLYLSFAGGPILERLRTRFGAQRPRPLYCSVDPRDYFPVRAAKRYRMGYLGTYSPDRQPALERLLLEPARRLPHARFCVAGAQYPDGIDWPANVVRVEHLAPAAHRDFYNSQRFTLNITRARMIANGYSPSVRLFEAAACEVPIITDEWPGLEEILVPGREVLVARTSADALRFLDRMDEEEAAEIARRARDRVLLGHTATVRAMELERHVDEARAPRAAAEVRTPVRAAAAAVEKVI